MDLRISTFNMMEKNTKMCSTITNLKTTKNYSLVKNSVLKFI